MCKYFLTISAMVLCACVADVYATTYYVNPTGAGGEFSNIQTALNTVSAGDSIIIRDGTYNLGAELYTNAAGSAAQRITVKAENAGGAILTNVGHTFLINQPYYTIEGLIFDSQYGWGDTIRLRTSGDELEFRNNIVRRGAKDGIDISDQQNVLIEDCTIHDMLAWDGGRIDAHGIVTGGVKNLTIRNTEIYYVSGDSLQTQDGHWENVLVDGCTFWNGDLPTARAGFPAGVNPGENAIDTKEDGALRSTMTLRNSVFYGWDSDYIFGSALNLKELVDVVVDGCELYDNNVAFRLRGRTGDMGAHVTVINNVMHDNAVVIRYEDDIQELQVLNNTWGSGNTQLTHSPDYPDVTSGFSNNLFLGAMTGEATHDASNRTATIADFLDPANHDYRLVPSSGAIDAGIDLAGAGVLLDHDGYSRPEGSAYDVGAFEGGYILGDTDKDGDVDATDLAALGLSWSPSGTTKVWADGDFDRNGNVDATDLATLGLGWNPSGSSVPEPATLLVMAFAGLPVLLRRGRSRN
ncbi:MAG: right-handed parallel beta-helix repeat-containing protein [Planctomycetes bacterium]|nr:right-handed parallel beta-helix repeat-containing protein [Planctomycetota bacterium]